MTTTNKFDNAKIYRLFDITTGMFYYGHTCLTRLDQRYNTHKNARYYKVKQYYKVYNYFTAEKFDVGDIKIELVDEPKVNNKRELEKIENMYILQYINNPLCVNTIKSYIASEDKIQAKREWANKYAAKKLSENVTCGCGSTFTAFQKTKHEKSKKHQDWVNGVEKEYGMIDNVYAKCLCGSIIKQCNYSCHRKTEKHQSWLTEQKQTAETI